MTGGTDCVSQKSQNEDLIEADYIDDKKNCKKIKKGELTVEDSESPKLKEE